MTVGQAIRATLAELSPGVRARLGGVEITPKGRPDARDLARGAAPDQLGYFYGTAPEPAEPGAPLPDQRPAAGEVVIFCENLRPLTSERLRIVLLHELGHALGYDEDEVHAMGLCL